MMNRSSYRIMVKTAKYMDQYYLDPLIGLIPGGVGDVLRVPWPCRSSTTVCRVVRSIPLTLAVIYNVLLDVLIGAIPFVGNVLDIFKRSYLSNLRLITGYIEDDKEIISKVRKKALVTAVLIAIVCALLCLVVKLALMVATWFS